MGDAPSSTAVDYFPLAEGLRLEYETRASTTRRFALEVLSVARRGGGEEARVRRTELAGAAPAAEEYAVRKGPDGVYRRDLLEFPLPASAGRRWTQAPRSYEIAAVDARADVPAGRFEACLRVSYDIAQGDGGGGERLYAPGVGLVREDCRDEAEPFETVLVRFSRP